MSLPGTPQGRPGSKGAAAIGVFGSKPPTAAPGTPLAAPGTALGTPRTGTGLRSSGTNAEISALAQKLILKLRAKFGDSAADVKGQEIISQEVLGFVKRGVSVKEEDVVALEVRIRQRLTGGTPVTNTRAMDKKAQMAGDEWANIFQYNIAEGKEKDKQEWLAMKERQRRTRETLEGQMKERDAQKQAEQREEQEYARQEHAALQAWEASEAERKRLQHEIALKLKQEREEQLVDKNTRRQNAYARVRAEEEALASKIAYETRAEFEKEEQQRVQAKQALRTFLTANDEHKKVKEAAKLAAWEEDAYFQKAWRDVLDKQDRDRRDRLEKTMNRQAKTAAFVNSGALPEYKKWIDPAITQKHFNEREERLARQEKEKIERTKAQEMATVSVLKQQMHEREAAAEAQRREDEAKAQVVLSRARAEEDREQAARAAREAAKLRFKSDLERQMKENVARRRNQPITEVERSINKELLDKVGTWKQTGRVNVA